MKYLGFGSKKSEYQSVNKETQLKLQTDKSPVWCIKKASLNLDILKQLLLDRYGNRQQALNALMVIGTLPYKAEGDFFNNFINYFDVDVECLCKGLYDLSTDSSFHIKAQMGKGKAGKIYSFEMNGDVESLVIKTINFKDMKSYLSVRTYSINEDDKLINPSNRINVWKNQKGEEKIIVAEGTDFSNQTCLHLILNTILQDNPNYIYQYDAFICRKDGEMIGYTIMEKAQKTLDRYIDDVNMTNELMNEIIRQTFSPLSILKKSIYGFSHSDLKPRNIFVSTANNIPVFKIADYDKSCITWNSVRFYNGSRDVNAYTDWLQMENFKIKTDVNGDKYYKLYTRGGDYGTLQAWTMHNHMGVPLSYDFYTFMIITLLLPKVWKFIRENENNVFTQLWRYMWYSNDVSTITKFIENHHVAYDSMQTEEAKSKYLDKMQSIGELNKFLASSNLKFKYDIAPFFKIVGLNFVDDMIDKNNYFIESNGNKICYDKCVNGKCNTNKYSKLSMIYEYDNCTEL